MKSTVNKITVSASSGEYEGWHQIDWRRAHRTVKGIQIRIAKATKAGNWRRVKSLQRMLTRSFSAKALAVKRVTENQGHKTPGVDGKTWSTPNQKWTAIHTLKRRGYKPQPLKRVYIPKSNGTKRPLGIPTMTDRAMQALYLLALEPVSESRADNNSYGFRTHRCTADAIEQCFGILCRKSSVEWILEGDIEGCFDNISHDWLLANIPLDKQVLRKWLKAGFIETSQLFPTESGTPQGGIISPCLANMALDGLESELKARFGKQGSRKGQIHKVHLVRYADDFIITGTSPELLENEVKPLVKEFLAGRGLKLSERKTRITHIDTGFDFLGWNVRKYNGKLLIKPSKDNVKAFLANARTTISRHKMVKQDILINILNRKISGWTNYHASVVSKRTFSYVDHKIFQALWRWAKRRHSNKSRRWVKDKYFRPFESQNWVFNDVKTGAKLRIAAHHPIRRHTKIKGDANPYLPEFELYLERRADARMLNNLKERNRLRTMWKRQKGICPMCSQRISKESGWNVHHTIPKAKGGSDCMTNLVMLHPNCHRQGHVTGFPLVGAGCTDTESNSLPDTVWGSGSL